jgi:hypothetical protein
MNQEMIEVEIVCDDRDDEFVERLNRELDALLSSAGKNRRIEDLSSAGNEVDEGKKWGFGGFVNDLKSILQNLHFPTFSFLVGVLAFYHCALNWILTNNLLCIICDHFLNLWNVWFQIPID